MSSPRFSLTPMDFSQPQKNFKASISVPAKQIDTSCAEKEKVRRYICLTFSPSPISVTVTGVQTMISLSERKRDRKGGMKDRRSDGEEGKRLREKGSLRIDTEHPPGAVYLPLFTQRIRLC